jgi:flagellar motility protein MotE (MotC chaperone)
MDMPAAAGEGLYWLPAEEAAALLRRLDLEFAVHVLAKMS